MAKPTEQPLETLRRLVHEPPAAHAELARRWVEVRAVLDDLESNPALSSVARDYVREHTAAWPWPLKRMPESWDVLARHLDGDGRLELWPSKSTKRRAALHLLAARFSAERAYDELEVNAVLDDAHTFGDPALLRRELVAGKFLDRTRDGRRYWLREPPAS